MAFHHSINPFEFLTPSRKKAIHFAIDSANRYQQTLIEPKKHIYDEHMSNRGRTSIAREWGIAHILEALSDDEGVVSRHVWNMAGIQFDKLYFVRVVKIEDPNFPPKEPKIIQNARHTAYHQAELPFPDKEETTSIPIKDLYPIVAGYTLNTNSIITELYFIDQYGDTVRDYYPLGYSSSFVTTEDQVKLPKTTFKVRPKFIGKEEQA